MQVAAGQAAAARHSRSTLHAVGGVIGGGVHELELHLRRQRRRDLEFNCDFDLTVASFNQPTRCTLYSPKSP